MAKPDLDIDPVKEEDRITAFIRGSVRRARAKGVVLGLSGGVDSAVVGAMCVRALGSKNVMALLMPSRHTPPEDVKDAWSLASEWGVKAKEIGISGILRQYLPRAGAEGNRVAEANLQARVRMTILYYHANVLGYLVVGTGDRSEELLGFFTKFGDGGVDLLPIAHLYKTQVRQLGRALGLPSRIVEKPASPQLWPGHTAEEELPAGYEKLDLVLACLFDYGTSARVAATRSGVSRAVVGQILAMNKNSAHKRALPPSPV